ETTEDERAHQELAQLGVGLDERAQPIGAELEHLAVLGDPSARQAAPAVEQADLAGELAGTVDDDQIFLILVGPDDLQGAREDHEERRVLRALIEEQLAAADGAPGAM